MIAWRHVIAVEGEAAGDGRFIEPGALTWETPLPILGPSDPDDDAPWSYPIIGSVESIERDGHVLIGTGTFFTDPPLIPERHGWCITVDDAKWTREPFALTAGRIRGAYLGAAVWPQCEVTQDTGGIVPPYITDRIPGHEGDQP